MKSKARTILFATVLFASIVSRVSSNLLCPGKPSENYCDCAGDCTNQPEWCACEEAQECCRGTTPINRNEPLCDDDTIDISGVRLVLKNGAENYADCDGEYVVMTGEEWNGHEVYLNKPKNRILMFRWGSWLVTGFNYWPEFKRTGGEGMGGGFHQSSLGDTDSIYDSLWTDYDVVTFKTDCEYKAESATEAKTSSTLRTSDGAKDEMEMKIFARDLSWCDDDKIEISGVRLVLKKGAQNYADCDGEYVVMTGEEWNGHEVYLNKPKNRILMFRWGSWLVTGFNWWPEFKRTGGEGMGGGYHHSKLGDTTSIYDSLWTEYDVVPFKTDCEYKAEAKSGTRISSATVMDISLIFLIFNFLFFV